MERGRREILKVTALCFCAMLLLPAAYRLWLRSHPESARPRATFSEYVAKAVESRLLVRLKTPVSKWTDEDRAQEPQVFAWLETQAKVVLPWEWSEAARRKDPSGYRAAWADIFRAREKAVAARLRTVRKDLEKAVREVRIAETLHAHGTNELRRIETFVASNAFPMTVSVVRLAKGRLWGWNRREERTVCATAADFADGETRTGLLFDLRAEAVRSERDLAERRRAREDGERCAAVCEDLLMRARKVRERIEKAAAPEDLPVTELMLELCQLIRLGSRFQF